MCGIVGVWNFKNEPVGAAELERMRDTLLRRGPDDAGMHLEPGIGLGHRRLSIIDLSPAGRMPMSNETAEVWAVFNGEIYNFSALREELEARGHLFKSRTDSEVIVHAYEEWGTDCFAKFDGMFAIAIWDRRTRRLVLARDITGEKPLYFWHVPSRCVVFGSTLTPLLTWKNGPRRVSSDALRLYTQFGFVPSPHCILEGVQKVSPGTFLSFRDDGSIIERAYWSLEKFVREGEQSQARPEANVDTLHEILRGAVRSRLVSDVPLGAFLSGGIDSSLVVALMAEVRPETVRTFTIGFREAEFDESPYARAVAKHLGVENQVLVLSGEDVLRGVDSVVRHFDEPMADYSVLPGLAVSRLARQHVTVALTGDGADEAFGGYRYYAGSRIFERASAVIPHSLRKLAAKAAPLVPVPRLSRAAQRMGVKDTAAFFGLSGFFRGGVADNSLLRVQPRRAGDEGPEDIVARYIRTFENLSHTEAGMVWDATRTLADAWLTKVDRSSMAFGLETRSPLLDRRVLEFAFSLPFEQRVRGTRSKVILRKILNRYVPRELIERPKQGFTAPLKSWFAGELKAELHDRLASNRIARLGDLDAVGVQELLAEQESGRANHTQMLWALFHLDQWYEYYLEKKSFQQESAQRTIPAAEHI